MKRLLRTAPAAAVVLGAALLVAACGSKSNPVSNASVGSTAATAPSSSATQGTVVIGSANFPENELLADIYAAALKKKGVDVKTQLNIGSREVIYKLIQKGSLTVLPEYNGALLGFLDPKATASTKAAVDTALMSKLDPSLEILTPSAAEDKDSLNVTRATAGKYHLASISDLSGSAGQLTLGGPPEFKTRLEGIAGLKSVYGLSFKGFKPLDEAGPLTIQALKGGQVQVADIFSTDPSIVTNGFVTLSDPKSLFSAQNVTPLVYKAGVNATVTDTLNAVSAKLDTKTLVDLVAKVVSDKQDATKVASDFVATLS